MNWIEITLLADGEMAEAVAEVLGRYAPGRVVIASTGVQADAEDVGRIVGPLKISAYLPDDENLERLKQQIEEGLYYLGRIHRPLPAPTFTPLLETNWAAAWKEHYHPIPLGRRLLILPAWRENPDPSRLPIVIEPGMAFGTGTHPTTQICLELLETAFSDRRRKTGDWLLSSVLGPRPSVIDLGCGSGILAIAARKLGAAAVLGVDIDPDALENARQNAALNGLADQIAWGVGSVREIREGRFSLTQADVLLANILAPVIIRLLEGGLAGLLAENGVMILSGILAEQEAEVRAALAQQALKVMDRRQAGDWVGLVAR